MEQRRLVRVVQVVAAQPDGSLVERICSAAAADLEAETAISVTIDDGLLQTVCTTAGGRAVEALQTDLGEGPTYDAHREGRPVSVEDLELAEGWPAFAPAATDLGVRSMFAFPLRSGSARLGTFTLSRPRPGELDLDHHADALVFARLTLDLLLAVQAGREVDDLDQLFSDGSSNAAEIHQAAGMVSIQLGLTVAASLAVLRARAYSDARSLREVARDVVARRLRLDHDG